LETQGTASPPLRFLILALIHRPRGTCPLPREVSFFRGGSTYGTYHLNGGRRHLFWAPDDHLILDSMPYVATDVDHDDVDLHGPSR